MKPVIPVVALVLLATMVTGREQPAAPAERLPPAAPRIPPQQPAASTQHLDLERLVRRRQDRTFNDLFAVPSPAPPVEPARRLAAPVPIQVTLQESTPIMPSAPPLPFAYLGRMVNGDRIVAYVLKGEQMHLAEAGQVIGEEYRVEGVTDSGVHFLYIPLGTKQVLTFPVRE